MAETDVHRYVLFEVIDMLKSHFAGRSDVYVSGDLLVFYQEGDAHKHLAPDVLVVPGVPNHLRDNFKIWEEGKAPEWVLEITSRSTRKEDRNYKYNLYQDTLRVKEYFLFDPFGEWLQPNLLGYRLVGGKYRPVEAVAGRLPSEVLGLYVEASGERVRFFDPALNRPLLTARERATQAEAAARQAEESLREVQAARQQAEAELERLRRELDALRNRPPEGT